MVSPLKSAVKVPTQNVTPAPQPVEPPRVGSSKPPVTDAFHTAPAGGVTFEPPSGQGSVLGVLAKKNEEYFLSAGGYTFELLAGGGAKQNLANAAAGDAVRVSGEFKVLEGSNGGPMRRVIQTDDAVVVPTTPIFEPPQGPGSITGLLTKKGEEYFLSAGGFTFEVLAGGDAKQQLARAASGDRLHVSGEFKLLEDSRGGPMRRVVQTDDVSAAPQGLGWSER